LNINFGSQEFSLTDFICLGRKYSSFYFYLFIYLFFKNFQTYIRNMLLKLVSESCCCSGGPYLHHGCHTQTDLG